MTAAHSHFAGRLCQHRVVNRTSAVGSRRVAAGHGSRSRRRPERCRCAAARRRLVARRRGRLGLPGWCAGAVPARAVPVLGWRSFSGLTGAALVLRRHARGRLSAFSAPRTLWCTCCSATPTGRLSEWAGSRCRLAYLVVPVPFGHWGVEPATIALTGCAAGWPSRCTAALPSGPPRRGRRQAAGRGRLVGAVVVCSACCPARRSRKGRASCASPCSCTRQH